MKVKVKWSPEQECRAFVFNLDPASKLMTTKFEQAAKDYLAEFPILPMPDAKSNGSTQKANVWQSKGKGAGRPPKDIVADAQTVATTASLFTNSSKVTSDLQSLRKNMKKLRSHINILKQHLLKTSWTWKKQSFGC
jgi:hypothetical protein